MNCISDESQVMRVFRNQVIELTLPFSEVCVHMKVHNTRMLAHLKSNGMVQLLRSDFSPSGGSITAGEAGFNYDDKGYYIPLSRNPILKADEWGVVELNKVGGGFSWEHDDRDYVC